MKLEIFIDYHLTNIHHWYIYIYFEWIVSIKWYLLIYQNHTYFFTSLSLFFYNYRGKKFELNIYIKKRSEFYILEKEGITVMREKEENVDAISIISIRKRRISNVPSTNKSFNRLNGYCSNPYYLESRFKGDRNRANFYTVS